MSFEKCEILLAFIIFAAGLLLGSMFTNLERGDDRHYNSASQYYASEEFHEDMHKVVSDMKAADDLVAKVKLENLKIDMCAESYAAGMADAKAIMNANECMILEFPNSNGMYAFRDDVDQGQIAEGWGIHVPSGDVVDVCEGVDKTYHCVNKAFSVSARSCFE